MTNSSTGTWRVEEIISEHLHMDRSVKGARVFSNHKAIYIYMVSITCFVLRFYKKFFKTYNITYY
jgi:hypothetical protein